MKAKPGQQDLFRDQTPIIKKKKKNVRGISELSDPQCWKNRVAFHYVKGRTVWKTRIFPAVKHNDI